MARLLTLSHPPLVLALAMLSYMATTSVASGQQSERITLRVGAGIAVEPEQGSGFTLSPAVDIPVASWLWLSATAHWSFIVRDPTVIRAGVATDSLTYEGSLALHSPDATIGTAGLAVRVGTSERPGRIGLKGILGLGGYLATAPRVTLDPPFHTTGDGSSGDGRAVGMYWELGGGAALAIAATTAIYCDLKMHRTLIGSATLGLYTIELGGSMGL